MSGRVEIVAVAERVPVGDIDTRGVKDRAPGREIVALREAVSSAVALAERVARVRSELGGTGGRQCYDRSLRSTRRT